MSVNVTIKLADPKNELQILVRPIFAVDMRLHCRQDK